MFDEAPYNDKPYGPNWASFDEDIARAGGIDVMVIGLGFDGYFCSNAPFYTSLDKKELKLYQDTIHSLKFHIQLLWE